ncbi:AraC family transcriptional regulator [Neorhizobium sp. JUb45]|uniref:helix-turn-helix domain-containing protein n=1 Tax=unclassified Neorhizobium TaxID=2629175 RepID=UPI0010EA7D44|nr:AraC family transcriptional regulator [Neorhizobium sp. JUb45]TCR06096.1 AraC family transcriptional regulator [Neorhizobium sp. JUb45]
MKSLETFAHEKGEVGRYFGIAGAPCLTTVPVKSASLTVTRLRREVSGSVPVPVRLPAENAYFLMLYLSDVSHCDIRLDGSLTKAKLYPRGSVCLVDLKEGASIMLLSRLDSLAFVIPYDLFDEMGDLLSDLTACGLHCRRGEVDAMIGYVGQALLPLFERPDLAAAATLRHMAIALCTHLLHDYGHLSGMEAACRKPPSLLSDAQLKAAKDFVLENLQKNLSISLIAAAAGVSPRHLSAGFREATGYTPHQWLMHVRIARAKDLLSQRSLSLQTIAHRCGFSDHSHLSRAFLRETGMSPGAWRGYRLQ